jgi:hypothetical protein
LYVIISIILERERYQFKMQWWQSVIALVLTIAPVHAIWPAPANMTTGENVLWLKDSVLVNYNGYLV